MMFTACMPQSESGNLKIGMSANREFEKMQTMNNVNSGIQSTKRTMYVVSKVGNGKSETFVENRKIGKSENQKSETFVDSTMFCHNQHRM